MQNIKLSLCLFVSIFFGIVIGSFTQLSSAHSFLITAIIATFFALRLMVYGNISLQTLHQQMKNPSKTTIVNLIYPFDLIIVLVSISIIML